MEIIVYGIIVTLVLWTARLLRLIEALKLRIIRSDAIIELCRMTIHNAEYLTPAERLEVLTGIEAYQEDVK